MNDENEKHDESLRSLIEAVVNGEASKEQHQRLEQRLIDDKQARDAWLNYTNLHASLSGWFLASESGEPLEDDLVDLPLLLSREHLEKSKTLRSYAGWFGAIAASALLLIIGVYQSPWMNSVNESSVAEGPTIIQSAGEVRVESADGQSLMATDRYSVRVGDTVVASSDEDRIVMQYADGTEIVLLGTATLTINDSPHGGKQLKLKNGLLRASVTRQPPNAPLLIVTPQAHVRVLGTRFELATDEQDGTRLDLESGKVELVRGEERPVQVEPNSIAIVPTTPDPIRVSQRPVVVDTPLRETVFRGLKSVAFAADGETLIAGTRWQAFYWYSDDRLEALPFNSRGREGISLRQQADLLLAYFDHQHRKLVIWDAGSRQVQFEVDNIARLKRQFPSSPDRPSSWNPASKVAVVSPLGDWFVLQVGREFRVCRDGENRSPEFCANYDGQYVGALAASPDGNTLAVAVRRGRVDLVDLRSEKVTSTWPLRGKVPFAMDFAANGQNLAVGLAGRVAVHDVKTGDVLADFQQPGLPFLKVAISADGRFVAASSLGDRVWMWDVTGGIDLPLIDIGEQTQDLAFSPSGDRLAVLARGGRLTVWEIAGVKSGTNSR